MNDTDIDTDTEFEFYFDGGVAVDVEGGVLPLHVVARLFNNERDEHVAGRLKRAIALLIGVPSRH